LWRVQAQGKAFQANSNQQSKFLLLASSSPKSDISLKQIQTNKAIQDEFLLLAEFKPKKRIPNEFLLSSECKKNLEILKANTKYIFSSALKIAWQRHAQVSTILSRQINQ
jgi:hypothetical protein